jgi:hypothetical protein
MPALVLLRLQSQLHEPVSTTLTKVTLLSLNDM